MNSKNANGEAEASFICARILRVDDETNCLEFVKLDGDNCAFRKHFKKISAQLSDYNNTALL